MRYRHLAVGWVALLAVLITAPASLRAETPSAKRSFDKVAAPFLKRHCLRCHDADSEETDLRLDTISHDLAAGRDLDAWRTVVARVRAGEMPPEDEQQQPTAAERQAFVARLTARLPRTVEAGERHWAFAPLERPAGESIDHFVGRKLTEADLQFSSRAQPRRLLRRLYLDLVGLPPTPAESDKFAADPSPESYERIVDDLLSRPQYGERWARHWLDLAGYADSNGLHQDGDRPHAWRYRDYVIDSFNADKPYGQFIREQLAGDELFPEDPQAWIATGFCRTAPSNEENVALAELESYRLDQLDQKIATTAQVFLGQTLQCARCHDHKLEPFTLTDYYRLLAVFDNTVSAYVPLGKQKQSKNRLGKPVFRKLRPRDKRKPPNGQYIRALTDLPERPRTTHVLYRGNHQKPGPEAPPAVPEVLRRFSAKFTVEANAKSTGRRAALARWIASTENPLTWRVMANRIWQHHFGRGIVATPSNFGTAGAKPTHPQLLDFLACELRDGGGRIKRLHRMIVLSRTYQQSSSYRRPAAAVDPESRLLWRYPPHRLEAEAIRDSILAVSGKLNLRMGGPGIKPRVPAEILSQSKRNTWPNVKQEGPQHWRRSVYIYYKRQLPMPLLKLLDVPDATQSCAARFESTTPTQSLALLNDEFVSEQAGYLVDELMRKDKEDVVRRMLARTWGVSPTEQQLADARRFIADRTAARKGEKDAHRLALVDLGVVLFNSSQFIYVD